MELVDSLNTYREQGIAPGIFHWLDKLERSVTTVKRLDIEADIRETTFDISLYDGTVPLYRSFAPTGFYFISVEFLDGQSERKSFTSQELGLAQ